MVWFYSIKSSETVDISNIYVFDGIISVNVIAEWGNGRFMLRPTPTCKSL